MAWGDTCGNIKLCCPKECVLNSRFVYYCDRTPVEIPDDGSWVYLFVSNEIFVLGLPDGSDVGTTYQPVEIGLRITNDNYNPDTFLYDTEIEVELFFDQNPSGSSTKYDVEISCGAYGCQFLAIVDNVWIGAPVPTASGIAGSIPIYVSNRSADGCPAQGDCDPCDFYTVGDWYQYQNTDTSAAEFRIIDPADRRLLTKGDVVQLEVETKASDNRHDLKIGYNYKIFRPVGPTGDPTDTVNPFGDETVEGQMLFHNYPAAGPITHPQVFTVLVELVDIPGPDLGDQATVDASRAFQVHLRGGNDRRAIDIGCGSN